VHGLVAEEWFREVELSKHYGNYMKAPNLLWAGVA
jgi:hypothetical protein